MRSGPKKELRTDEEARACDVCGRTILKGERIEVFLAPGGRDARHVRAVPTTAEVKVERALEVFNDSDHPRTIAGIARTLGAPWVHASPDGGAPSEVTIVVAWELSWYRYRVDLGDEHEPIVLVEKGDELGELEESRRAWNAVADDGGRLSVDVGSAA